MQSSEKQRDTRDRILETALRLFCERGYAAVGTQEICEASGVLKGSLYHYFGSKLEVALAALKSYGEDVRAQFEEVARSNGTPEQKLLRVFETARRQAASDVRGSGVMYGCLHGNLAQELSATQPRVREAMEAISDGWAEALVPILEGLEPGADASRHRQSALSVLAYLHGVVLMAKTANDPDLITELARRSTALVVASRGQRRARG